MRLALAALFLSLLAAGCGGAESTQELPLLPARAVPSLESTTQDIGASELEADFGGADAHVTGLVAGRERVFQGESQRLDRVVSRTLQFDSAADAEAYVEALRTHVVDLYGPGTTAKSLESGGRTGYLVDPAACACHRAEPTLTAALSRGKRVTYLEINGGGASPASLRALLAEAP
jgi:hypothetical protein